jgi:thioredoxin reductase
MSLWNLLLQLSLCFIVDCRFIGQFSEGHLFSASNISSQHLNVVLLSSTSCICTIISSIPDSSLQGILRLPFCIRHISEFRKKLFEMAFPSKTSVLIVGAGPAGLVAAKTFKQAGYVVTVYEAADRVGGMWRDKRGGPGDKCSPDMRTNLSRFTVAFSDLSWTSVDSDPPQSIVNPPPIFPKAWQAGQYLETYAKTFGIVDNIKLQTRVVDTCLQDDQTWKVTADDGSGKLNTSTFDRLIIASGFFDKPAQSFDPSVSKNLANIQHSSRFRSVSELSRLPGKIAVIGGGISGSEAASQAAFQISNAKHSPSKDKPAHAASTVYHVFNRPFYCLQRYFPQDPKDENGKFNPAPKFIPLDLILDDLSRRGDGELTAAISTVPPEKAKKGHEFLRSSLGGDQSNFGYPEITYDPEYTQHPGYTGITDTYMEFVRDGTIVPVQGWVEKVEQQKGSELFDIDLKQYKPWYHTSGKELIVRSLLAHIYWRKL